MSPFHNANPRGNKPAPWPRWWRRKAPESAERRFSGCVFDACSSDFILEIFPDLRDPHPFLLHRIPLADRDFVVIDGLKIHGNAVGRADFVLAAVSSADGRCFVVLDHPAFAETSRDIAPEFGQRLFF